MCHEVQNAMSPVMNYRMICIHNLKIVLLEDQGLPEEVLKKKKKKKLNVVMPPYGYGMLINSEILKSFLFRIFLSLTYVKE